MRLDGQPPIEPPRRILSCFVQRVLTTPTWVRRQSNARERSGAAPLSLSLWQCSTNIGEQNASGHPPARSASMRAPATVRQSETRRRCRLSVSLPGVARVGLECRACCTVDRPCLLRSAVAEICTLQEKNPCVKRDCTMAAEDESTECFTSVRNL